MDYQQLESSQWSDHFKSYNWSTSVSKLRFLSRASIIVILIGVTIVNSFTAMILPKNEIDCIWDGLHWMTSGANQYFLDNKEARNAILIVSSLLIDLLVLHFSYRYILWGKSSRPVLFLVFFYSLRMLCQSVFYMRFPEGYNWGYPGFPSLTVSYAESSDFFFSGHVGVVTFLCLENYSQKNFLISLVAAFSILFEFFVMVVLRGHYSIGLIAGFCIAHYIWFLVKVPARWIDTKMGYPVRTGIDRQNKF